jgi:Flp pilus assembly protein CpaB
MQDTVNKLFRNRSGALIAGLIAAIIAVVLLVVYLKSYRSSVNSGKRTERVLVATKLIPAGTSGTLIASQGLYLVTTVQQDQLKLNAITDPSALNDRVAAGDIFPGQQLTQDDFTTESPQSIPYQIVGKQRAIEIPVDANHGLIGQIAAGNFVDVYVGVSGAGTAKGGAGNGQLVTLLAADVFVLSPPGGTNSSGVILRVPTQQVAKFAYAADNATIWLVARPQVGAAPTPPSTATLATLLAGVK